MAQTRRKPAVNGVLVNALQNDSAMGGAVAHPNNRKAGHVRS
jgi:hypothetical protein